MRRWPKLSLVGCFVGASLAAQTLVQQKRADGAITPLMVYSPATTGAGCAPLALISHGAGGSERGLQYLAKGLAEDGWLAIVMGHRESGKDALLNDLNGKSNRQDALQQLVATPAAYTARLQDVGAGLTWAKAQCRASGGIPFRALLGHSMGGITVMMEAGATSVIELGSPPLGQNRFDAYVSMSTQGPGKLFGDSAWAGIRKPMFVLTGTRDGALHGGYQWRTVPYDRMPSDGARSCHWLGVVAGATHSNFAGHGPDPARVEALVVPAVASFLEGARAGHCALPPKQPGFSIESK